MILVQPTVQPKMIFPHILDLEKSSEFNLRMLHKLGIYKPNGFCNKNFVLYECLNHSFWTQQAASTSNWYHNKLYMIEPVKIVDYFRVSNKLLSYFEDECFKGPITSILFSKILTLPISFRIAIVQKIIHNTLYLNCIERYRKCQLV